MRWALAEGPKIGDRRTVRVYLWEPLCLQGEYRWLEQVDIVQEWGWWAHEDPNYWKYVAWADRDPPE